MEYINLETQTLLLLWLEELLLLSKTSKTNKEGSKNDEKTLRLPNLWNFHTYKNVQWNSILSEAFFRRFCFLVGFGSFT